MGTIQPITWVLHPGPWELHPEPWLLHTAGCSLSGPVRIGSGAVFVMNVFSFLNLFSLVP